MTVFVCGCFIFGDFLMRLLQVRLKKKENAAHLMSVIMWKI